MVSITFRLSEEEKEILQKEALKNDLSVSQIVRKAVREYIEKLNQNQ